MDEFISALRDGIEGEVRLDGTSASIYEMDPVGVVIPRTVKDVVSAVALARDFLVSRPRRHRSDILGMPPNFEVAEIPSGCCGMAGAFGYAKEHYGIAMKVGEDRLFKAVRSADEDVVIAAPGTSCRHQISDATGKVARHWVEILVEAL